MAGKKQAGRIERELSPTASKPIFSAGVAPDPVGCLTCLLTKPSRDLYLAGLQTEQHGPAAGGPFGFISYVIDDYLDLADQEKQDVLEAGYLSDIGKSIVPHHLLNRRGRLSTEEFLTVHKHPREGVSKLKQMGYESEAVFEIIENHHENVFGGGYPNGKTKKDIPIGARIVAVAEAYSSFTSWRPYRQSWEKSSAIEEMKRDTANGQFDSHIMDLLGVIILADPQTAAVAHIR